MVRLDQSEKVEVKKSSTDIIYNKSEFEDCTFGNMNIGNPNSTPSTEPKTKIGFNESVITNGSFGNVSIRSTPGSTNNIGFNKCAMKGVVFGNISIS